MSYRCKVCNSLVPEGKPMTRLTMYRTVSGLLKYNEQLNKYTAAQRTEIAAELPICSQCDGLLARGTSLADLLRRYPYRAGGRQQVSSTAPPAPHIPVIQVTKPVTF